MLCEGNIFRDSITIHEVYVDGCGVRKLHSMLFWELLSVLSAHQCAFAGPGHGSLEKPRHCPAPIQAESLCKIRMLSFTSGLVARSGSDSSRNCVTCRRGSRISARGGRQENDDLIWDGNERFLTYANRFATFQDVYCHIMPEWCLNNHLRDTSVPSFCP